LILVLRVGTEAALVVLPESSGLIPSWCVQPDATGKAKLATLAVEFGALLLPESLGVTEGTGGYVHDLVAALQRAGLSARAARVAIQVQSGPQSRMLSLIWPATSADAALNEAGSGVPNSNAAAGDWADPVDQSAAWRERRSANGDFDEITQRPTIHYESLEDGLAQLPSYTRSLLKIRVPVMVTLAEAKQPVANVLAIGPGSIIHFNKPCEDTLALEIAGQKIALGEAVKVGDKFGLWITSMILPAERFWVLSHCARAERAK
jgi:flagellar motor switch/type III secretory pathway protein FliN